MKKLTTILSSLVMIFVLFSCSKTEQPYLSIDKSTVTVAANATTASINISSNVQWEITGSSAWCSFNPTSGEGTAPAKLSIQPHTGHGDRNATFILSSKKIPGSTIIEVVQTAAPNSPPTAPVLTSPENGATLTTTLPTFTWKASTDINGDELEYVLQISKDKSSWDSFKTSGLTYTLTSSLEPNTEYFWKVETSDGLGQPVASETRSFKTPNASN